MRFKKLILCIIAVCLVVGGCSKSNDKMTVEIDLEEPKETTTIETNTKQETVKEDVKDEEMDEINKVIDNYYEAYKLKEYDKIVGTFNQAFVDRVGGLEKANKMTVTRRLLIGEPLEYNVLSVEQKQMDGESAYIASVEVSYTTGQIAQEYLAIQPENETGKIVDLALDPEEFSKNFLDDYFKQLGDVEAMKAMTLPLAIEHINMDVFNRKGEAFKNLIGEFKNVEVIDGGYLYTVMPDIGLTIIYVGNQIKANYDNISVVGEVQIGEHNGEVGINFTDIYPEPVGAFYDAYYQKLMNKDVDGIMGLYTNVFYHQIKSTPDEWRPNIEYMVAEMGELKGYDIIDWNYGIQDLSDGSQMNILGIVAKLYFEGDKVYKEQMIINYDENEPMIQAYKIAPVE